MLLHEHQGKALLRGHGIATPEGRVVSDETALDAALRVLPPRLVLKAQIAGGGRGKAGGIAFADDAEQAHAAYAALRGRSINSHPVEFVLVEERIAYERERYAGMAIEDGELRLLFGRRGGIDIEEITAADPDNLIAIPVDPSAGPTDDALRTAFARLGYAPELCDAYLRTGHALFDLARACDATLVEINPLVELAGGTLLALDARIAIDDAALDRQPELAALQPPAELPARPSGGSTGLRFKQNPKGGSIGLIGLGGGLNVTLMDWIESDGARVASLVDLDPAIGAGHAREGFAEALDAFARDTRIRAVLVNVITCGYRLDDIVAGLTEALARHDTAQKPIVLHLRGNAAARMPAMLAAAGRSNSPSIAAAVAAVIAAAQG